ncbi:MAG: prephenate dehydrogenase/arogenate dehydrogenase family protein [Myxococcales bacterium]|nr:prephenate dehydrogenase/arogenate dehydrogenase family protein [Myxococcales bacterium]
MATSNLEELRAELGTIDTELLALIKRRQSTALRIGEAKRSDGRATRDYTQEANVLRRAMNKADSVGLDRKITKSLMLLLIRSSLSAQEQDRVAKAEGGDGKSALIIGGAGKMGQWFASFLRSQGFNVVVADPSGTVDGCDHVDDWQEGPLDQDLIVVATPLGTSATILSQLAKAKPAGVVFDIGSLKSPLRSGLHALRDAGVQVTSVHPMFGPDTDLLSERHVIFIDIGCEAANAKAKELFSSTMATQVDMDLESHDRLIAYVLGLSHALNLAFTTALAESGEAAPMLAKLSSTTFDAQLSLASSVTQENPKLYFEIQRLNDYGTESLTALLYAVERLRSVIRAGDERAFVTLMEKASSYLGGRGRDV